MPNHSHNDQKHNLTGKFPQSSNHPVRWQFLMIGNHGKVISIERFKEIAIFFLIIFIVSVSGAIGFFLLYQNKLLQNKTLKTSLAHYQQTVSKLQRENEILAARLVVNGIDAGFPQDDKKPVTDNRPESNEIPDHNDSGQSFTAESDTHINTESVAGTVSKNTPGQEKETAEEPGIPSEIQSGLVDIENFIIAHDTTAKLLKAQFKLNNTSNHKISGYIFVFLRHHPSDPDSCVSLPSVRLNNGRPDNYKSGHHFAISRFKTIRLKATDLPSIQQYVQADVFIYGKDGELIFKKEFPLNA